MIDVLFVDEQVILATTILMASVMAGMNMATLPRTAPKDSSIRNTMPPQQISFKALIHPQLKGQITLLFWCQTDISAVWKGPYTAHIYRHSCRRQVIQNFNSKPSTLLHSYTDIHTLLLCKAVCSIWNV